MSIPERFAIITPENHDEFIAWLDDNDWTVRDVIEREMNMSQTDDERITERGSDRISRTLVRVVNVYHTFFDVVIPGWDGGRKYLHISFDSLPPEMRKGIAKGQRLHVQANVGAEDKRDLGLHLWEPE